MPADEAFSVREDRKAHPSDDRRGGHVGEGDELGDLGELCRFPPLAQRQVTGEERVAERGEHEWQEGVVRFVVAPGGEDGDEAIYRRQGQRERLALPEREGERHARVYRKEQRYLARSINGGEQHEPAHADGDGVGVDARFGPPEAHRCGHRCDAQRETEEGHGEVGCLSGLSRRQAGEEVIVADPQGEACGVDERDGERQA